MINEKIVIELSEKEWEELKIAHVNCNFRLWNARSLLFGVRESLGEGETKNDVRNAIDRCGEAVEDAGKVYDMLIRGYKR